MRGIPSYALYGEFDAHLGNDWLHCETILSRSRLHGFEIRPHRHERFCQILWLAAGSAVVTLDGRAERLIPPSLVLLPALSVHGYTFSHDVEGLVITLFERQLPEILRACPEAAAGFDTPSVVALGDRPALARLVGDSLAAVAREFEQGEPGRLGMVDAHLAVALIAANRARLSAAAPVVGDPSRGADHVARFRRMVDREFRDRTPVDDYATRLGITATHLRRLCQEHLGQSALDTINGRIVLEAKRYLTFTALEVKEIAALLGFDDHAYFTRFFRREAGMAPSDFRRRQQGRDARPPRGPAVTDDGGAADERS